MLRILKWHTSVLLLGFLIMLQNQALPQAGKTVSSKHPNVVFIIADSHRGEALGINGHPFVQTPHLDQLAKGGIRFTSAYVTTAICSVSRASILSGQYRARHKINDFTTSFRIRRCSIPTRWC